MNKNKTNGVNAKNSTNHTADTNSAQDINFLRQTTDICYIIGGYYLGKLPDSETYMFSNESKQLVCLDMNKKIILADARLSRLQFFALDGSAYSNNFELDMFEVNNDNDND